MTVRNVERRLALGLTHGWSSEEARAALPATAGWRRRRVIVLVHAVEILPPGRDGETFVVNIYKDAAARKRFFPIVFRRAAYRLTRHFPERPFVGEVEAIDPAFAPDAFARVSSKAVLDAVLKRVRSLRAGA